MGWQAMMAVVLRYGWRFLTSRIGLAAVVCSLLWGWHVYDCAFRDHPITGSDNIRSVIPI
jgi:hypothetical protein